MNTRYGRMIKMSLLALGGFLQYLVIYSYTPGPANFFALKVASQYGYKHFLKVYPGLFCGCLSLMMVCNIVMHSFQRLLPESMRAFQLLGNLYILWVAWHIFRSQPIHTDEMNEKVSQKPTFLTGLFLNLTNMKIMIFGLTLMQMYILPYSQTEVQSILFTILISFLISTSTLCWAYCGKLLSKVLNRYHRLCNTIMAVLLIWCVVS